MFKKISSYIKHVRDEHGYVIQKSKNLNDIGSTVHKGEAFADTPFSFALNSL